MDDKIMMAKQLRRALELWAATFTDESTMLEVAGVYPKWKTDCQYKNGDIVRYETDENGEFMLWRVLQDHKSQSNWTPDTAVSLYKRIGITDDGINIWTQPLGASDAYEKGDIVSHKDKLWASTCDGNVWEPGVYGWELKD